MREVRIYPETKKKENPKTVVYTYNGSTKPYKPTPLTEEEKSLATSMWEAMQQETEHEAGKKKQKPVKMKLLLM